MVRNSHHIRPPDAPYDRRIYKLVRSEVEKSIDFNAICNENVENGNPLFVGVMQLCSDNTATPSKTDATVAYPVHIVLLNFTKEYRRFLIDHGHILVGLLPVFASECNKEENDSYTTDDYYRN